MATIKIKLTKDLLSLISNFRFQEYKEIKDDQMEANYGLDLNNLYGGSYLLEDISYIIGKYDEHIPGTEENAMGPSFPIELEEYMYGMHAYIIDNLEYIEDLVHQFVAKGGLTEGEYKCRDYERIWEKV